MSFGNKRRKRILKLSQIIVLTFLSLVVLGTLLLMLPFASKEAGSCGLLTALFTATSSVCVTGLSLVDVWSTFSLFGQVVILTLIELGGLGFMSAVSLLSYISSRRESLYSLSLIAESLGSDEIGHIARIQKRVIAGSLMFEFVGAFVLFWNFLPTFGAVKSIWYGLFHSISSFCNAGFDLMGVVSPGSGASAFRHNPVVLITLALLVIIGGIGFFVWDDLITSKSPRRWSVNTKLVLLGAGVLFIASAVLFFVMEYNNPLSIGNMSLGDKIVNSFFQSVTTRTAGFGVLDQASLSSPSRALTMMLMMIGGSAGSTAGGIKTVTIIILVKALISNVQGKKRVTLLHRTITGEQISYAFTITGSFLLLSIIGAFVIALTSGVAFDASLFESISALATVGLSLGITSTVSLAAKLILIVFMFIGRVGLLTIALGFFKAKENNSIKYPTVKVMIG